MTDFLGITIIRIDIPPGLLSKSIKRIGSAYFKREFPITPECTNKSA